MLVLFKVWWIMIGCQYF